MRLKALGIVLALGGAAALPGIAHAAGAVPFDTEAATRAYLDTLSGAARARSDAYFEGGYWLLLWGAVVTVLSAWILLHFGLSARLRSWAERVTRRRWLVPALYALPYVLVSTLIVAPWTIYADFIRERQYGLMSQSFGGWLGEQGINLVLSIVATALLLTVIFAAIRAARRSWWLWGAAAMTLFAMFAMLITPIFIAPLFNDYSEMKPGPLRDRIVAMAAANHVPAEHIYVFDQSRQHKRISANVSGLGPTIRISLNDNLLNRASEAEVAAVMGHELGHYVLGHVWRLIGGAALIFLTGFGVLYLSAPRIIARHGARWGVRDVADPAATPLLLALFTIYFLAITPVWNTMVRTHESAADRFGLDAAREPDGFANTAMKLSEYRKIEPGPIEEAIFFDHPSGATRVRMAMRWKADHLPKAPAAR